MLVVAALLMALVLMALTGSTEIAGNGTDYI